MITPAMSPASPAPQIMPGRRTSAARTAPRSDTGSPIVMNMQGATEPEVELADPEMVVNEMAIDVRRRAPGRRSPPRAPASRRTWDARFMVCWLLPAGARLPQSMQRQLARRAGPVARAAGRRP
jgi:hypothetical protein